MKRFCTVFAFVSLLFLCGARADALVSSVQQKLKDQGFYYGEITGQKDADTTAAIRRFQIRNGLKITGDLNAETQKSLGVKGELPAPTPTPTPQTYFRPQESHGLRLPGETKRPPTEEFAPEPRAMPPPAPSIFSGTPYERASLEVQQRVIAGAQSNLARRGYYRAAIDGVYGPALAFGVRAFQTRFGIAPSGRLDTDTLAAMGLLPGQRAPGVTAPIRGRAMRRPAFIAPNGEPVYQPR